MTVKRDVVEREVNRTREVGAMVVDKKFLIDKVREVFDLNKRIELAEKVLQETFGVPPLEWGTERDWNCKRAYAKYVINYSCNSDDDSEELVFIGEDEEARYYARYIEFKVMELHPGKYFYKDWEGDRVFDSHPEVIYELWKDIEAHGLVWRLYVRVGLCKELHKKIEEKKIKRKKIERKKIRRR